MRKIIRFLKKIGINKIIKKIKWLHNAYIWLYQLSIRKTIKNVHENGLECLEKAKAVCDRLGMFFWLDYGTLLGAVREKDFIAHDSDLDAGILYEEKNEKLESEMKKAGFTKIRDFTADNKIVLETYTYQGVELDFFYYFYDGGKMWAYTFSNKEEMDVREVEGRTYMTGINAYKVTFTKCEFKQIEFKNSKFFAPYPPSSYLAEVYGENFMIKNKFWNFMNSKNLSRSDYEEILCIHYNS